jgi:hypothetical protein
MAILTVETQKRYGWWRMKNITLPYFFFKPKVFPDKRITCDNGQWFIDGLPVDEVRNQVTIYAEPHFFLLEFFNWIASGFNGIRDRFALLVLHDLMQIEHSLSPIEGYPESQNKEETLRKSRGYLNEHKQHPFMDNDRCLEIYEALDHWSNMDEGPIFQADNSSEEKMAAEDESKTELPYQEPPKEKQPVAISASEVRPSWEDYLTQIEKLIEEMLSLLQSEEGSAITYSALAKKTHKVRLKVLRQYHPDPPGNTTDDEHFKKIEPILTALKEIFEGLANNPSVEKTNICRELTRWKANLADIRNIETILEIQERKRRREKALDNLLQELSQKILKIQEDLTSDNKRIAMLDNERIKLHKRSKKLDIEMKKDRETIRLLANITGLTHPSDKGESEHAENNEPQLSAGAKNRYRWYQQDNIDSTSTHENSPEETLLTDEDEGSSEEECSAESYCNV